MPHDKNGELIAKGDRVYIECEVTDVQTGANYCNTTLSTVEPMFPGTDKTTITVNAKQTVRVTPQQMQAFLPHDQRMQFSFIDFEVQARHVIQLLNTQGETALRIVGTTMKLIKAVTGRDMVGVFAAINQNTVDVQALIQAIRDEFGLAA